MGEEGDLHIFRRTLGGRARLGGGEGSGERDLMYMGALVPPEGPLILLLSVFILRYSSS